MGKNDVYMNHYDKKPSVVKNVYLANELAKNGIGISFFHIQKLHLNN